MKPILSQQVHESLTNLLTDHPEFGAPALHLEYVKDDSLPAAMATDGTHCFYNPAKLAGWTDGNYQFVIAHEAGHCMLQQLYRAELLYAEGFTHAEVNEAADYAINHLLISSNVGTPPNGVLHDPSFANLSFEEIARLRRARKQAEQAKQQQDQAQQSAQDQPQAQDNTQPNTDDDTSQDQDAESESADASDDENAPQDEQGGPSDDGTPSDGSDESEGAPDEAEQPSDVPGEGASDMLAPAQPSDAAGQPADAQPSSSGSDSDSAPLTADDWQTITEQAFAVTRKAGRMPGDVDRAISAVNQPNVDCWEVLRQFIEATAPSNYSWLHPNKRYVHQGIYLPGITKDNMPPIVIAIDTSGSVNERMLNEFGEHVTAIMNEFEPRAVHVIYCDTAIKHTETFEPGDEVVLHAKGGGGTYFAPVFDHIAADPDDIYSEVACLVYITDLQNYDTKAISEPAYPVLWATPCYIKGVAPFGERVELH